MAIVEKSVHKFHIVHNLEIQIVQVSLFDRLGELGKIGRAAKENSEDLNYLISNSDPDRLSVMYIFYLIVPVQFLKNIE